MNNNVSFNGINVRALTNSGKKFQVNLPGKNLAMTLKESAFSSEYACIGNYKEPIRDIFIKLDDGCHITMSGITKATFEEIKDAKLTICDDAKAVIKKLTNSTIELSSISKVSAEISEATGLKMCQLLPSYTEIPAWRTYL